MNECSSKARLLRLELMLHLYTFSDRYLFSEYFLV